MKVEQFKPDISFVDINMPVINGLNAINYAKSISPGTVFIIVTGYSEFEFAKRAIEIKVDNYLLKPVKPSDLKKVIDDSVQKQNYLHFEINKYFERLVIAKYHNVENIDINENTLNLMDSFSSFKSLIIIFDSRDSELIKRIKTDYFIQIRKQSGSFISKELMIAVFNTSDNILIVLAAFNDNRLSEANTFFSECEKTISDNNPDILISTFKNSFNSFDINKYYSDILQILPLRIIFRNTGRKNSLYFIQHENRDELLRICSLIDSLNKYYNNKNYMGYLNTIERLKENSLFLSVMKNNEYRKSITSYLNVYSGFNLKLQDFRIESWFMEITEFGEANISRKNSNSKYIDEVIEYIESNYMKDIGINTISEKLKITPNYLSAIFHKETNLKFTDYISKTRILRARKMLLESSLTIREISENVGYHSTRHFTKLFIKYTGQYPSTYRKKPE